MMPMKLFSMPFLVTQYTPVLLFRLLPHTKPISESWLKMFELHIELLNLDLETASVHMMYIISTSKSYRIAEW